MSSLMSRLIHAVAERLARHHSIPEANREAFRATAVVVMEGELRDLFGGEQVRLYIPKFSSSQRRAREERIAAALAAGESTDSIAKRESLSPQHVRRLRGRIGA